jgi:hypothetical protein
MSLTPEFLSELAAAFNLTVFIETGTLYGDSTAAALPLFRHVHTIELSADLATGAARRFAGIANLQVYQGDSADALPYVLGQARAQGAGAPLIWLDGHYSGGGTARGAGGNSPILQELAAVNASGIADAVILIDDLRMFDDREADFGAADPPSLGGYPSLQQLARVVAGMAQPYTLLFYGDAALVRAMTVSRLYDGAYPPLPDVLAAEEVIASARGGERAALRTLARSAFVRNTARFGLGLHYRYWDALAALGEDAGEAERELAATALQGVGHWRVKWFLARACAAQGKPVDLQGHLTGS